MSQSDQPTDPDATLVRGPLPPDPAETSATSRRAGVVAAIVAGTVLVLVGAVYLIGYVMAGDKLPREAQIAGVAVGGLSTADATEKLQAELGEHAASPIEVRAGDEKAQVVPAEAGLGVDWAASVELAGGGRSLDPRHIWRVLTGGSQTDPVIVTDADALDAAVAGLATKVDREPKDAKLAFDDGKVVQTDGKDGVSLDQERAADAIEQAYLTSDDPVDLPAEVTEPEVTTAEVAELATSYAKPAVSGPIRVRAGAAGSFTVTRAMIGDSISFVAADGTLKPQLDADELREAADDAVSEVELKKPKDATVKLVDGKPEVVPAVNGTTVTAADLAATVEPLLTKTGKDRTGDVQLTGAKASFSTEDAENLGIKRVTGKFTTYFPYATYRNVNIGRAAELINGTVLKPGETFSLNGIVGERTKANGFVEGYIIQGGKFKKELGGGVSQSATTTYNAMFFAGLKDIQHQPHTLYIDRYPPGREATVAWPSLDLKFQNDTDYGVLVQAYTTDATPSRKGSITVKMWSTKTYDEIDSSKLVKSNFTTGREITDDDPKCEPQAPVQGFDVDYSRIFRNDDKVVKTEKFHWRYAPTDRITCK
ncbi:MAG TPA: VanW family protein [Microlunatus sp.]|nr:VanW family protein [Microlunatus sp.]